MYVVFLVSDKMGIPRFWVILDLELAERVQG